VVYNISSGTTIRAVHGGSLLEGLKYYTLELDEHEGLRGLEHQSVIPYAHGGSYIVVFVCVGIVQGSVVLT
jgi:hypothetical protein